MKKFFSIVLLVLLAAFPAYALEETKQLKLQDAATATGNGTTMVVAPYTSIALQVTISDTATVTFEATQDGTTWASTVCTSSASTSAALVTSATATGLYQCPVAGFSEFRARISSYGSGSISVNARATTAVLGKKGGGGSGASITVKEADSNPSVSDVTTLQVTNGHLTDNGSGNVSIDLGGTLDNAFDNGKTIDGANSLANAVQIGDGITPTCLYTDATLGPQVRPCTDANVRQVIPTNFTGGVYDEEGAAMVETIDPDAATQLGKYTYGTAYKPLKSVWFGAGSLSTDGTQCAAPAEATPVASGPKLWTIICADNAASRIDGSVRMPDAWDGGTVTFTMVYQQTAADTAILNGDIACQARSNGEAPTSTWGTTQALDDAAVVGSGSNDMTTSAAVTCAGTGVAGGDMLYWKYLVATETTTAMATLHILGFNMEYSITSRSD